MDPVGWIVLLISFSGCIAQIPDENGGSNGGKESCRQLCPEVYNPVCGSDGRTYGNDCEFQVGACMAKYDQVIITVVNQGTCALPTSKSTALKPVSKSLITTLKPTKTSTTLKPMETSTTLKPTEMSTTLKATEVSTTLKPTETSSTLKPSEASSTLKPTEMSTSLKPAEASSSLKPTATATSLKPTEISTTLKATEASTTLTTTSTTLKPTETSSTLKPTVASTTLKPTDMSTSLKPAEASSSLKPTVTVTSLKPTEISTTLKATEASTTLTTTTLEPTETSSTLKPTVASTTLKPTEMSTTVKSSEISTTGKPTDFSTTSKATKTSTTLKPTEMPTTLKPTEISTTLKPTASLTTLKPTKMSTTLKQTVTSTTLKPTKMSTTLKPTEASTTLKPSEMSTSSKPTAVPTTLKATKKSTTLKPTETSTTFQPTDASTTLKPTDTSTTSKPTAASTTLKPTAASTTLKPTDTSTTLKPMRTSTTLKPAKVSTTLKPTDMPTTLKPKEKSTMKLTQASTTFRPTSTISNCENNCDQVGYKPVCSTDGITYDNMCVLQLANCKAIKFGFNVEAAYVGPCISRTTSDAPPTTTADVCPPLCSIKGKNPVCGSNGITYDNLCALKTANCKAKNFGTSVILVSYGPCTTTPQSTTQKPTVKPVKCANQVCYKNPNTPLCTTDGQTFRNYKCFLKARCEHRQIHGFDLVIKYRYRPCPTTDTFKPLKPWCGLNRCTKINPVCGSDGKTYNCQRKVDFLKCNGTQHLTVIHQGPCAQTVKPFRPSTPKTVTCWRKCTTNYRPLCGSDGKTYKNWCKFNIAKCLKLQQGIPLRVNYQSECITTPISPTTVCDKQCDDSVYDPICGSDVVTYGNRCRFKEAQCRDPHIVKMFNGVCPVGPVTHCDRQCDDNIHSPVCGSDQVTYTNQCRFKEAQCMDQTLTMMHVGVCVVVPLTHCDRQCDDRIYSPVCGSDSVTYSSQCRFKEAQCMDQTLTLRHVGACAFVPPVTNCDRQCNDNRYSPVCGSDGVTYTNKCRLKEAQCMDGSLTWIHDGACAVISVKNCDQQCNDNDYSPVCGSDYITYRNRCKFEEAKCRDKQIGLRLTVEYVGVCKGWPGTGVIG